MILSLKGRLGLQGYNTIKSRKTCSTLLLVIILWGCSSSQKETTWKLPSSTFNEFELIGVWNSLGGVYTRDTLTIKSNHTFTYSFFEKTSSLFATDEGKWWIEKKESGCTYIHLEGMRYFHLTPENAESGNRLPDGSLFKFWDGCEKRFIEMPDKVVLIVGAQEKFVRGLFLEFPTYAPEGLDIIMHLAN